MLVILQQCGKLFAIHILIFVFFFFSSSSSPHKSTLQDSDILNLGTGSISWFEINGYGCIPTYSTNITSEDPYRMVRPESVEGCFLEYPTIEVIHSGVQLFFAVNFNTSHTILHSELFSFVYKTHTHTYKIIEQFHHIIWLFCFFCTIIQCNLFCSEYIELCENGMFVFYLTEWNKILSILQILGLIGALCLAQVFFDDDDRCKFHYT